MTPKTLLGAVFITLAFGCTSEPKFEAPPLPQPPWSECAAPATCDAACKTGDLAACTWLGEHAVTYGRELADRARGMEQLESTCAKGDGHACWVFATKKKRLDTLSEEDSARIAALERRACELGEAAACEDSHRKVALATAACNAGRSGCAIVLHYTTSVEDSAMKLVRAAVHRAFGACASGRARSCAAALELEDLYPPVLEEVACRAGATTGCFLRARRYDGTLGYSPDWATWAKRGCELGDTFECRELAEERSGG